MKLWLDDERPAPDGWVWVKDPIEAVSKLTSGQVTEASFDHDLAYFMGGREVTGYMVLCALEEFVAVEGVEYFANGLPKMTVHSANAGVRKKMNQAIASIEKMAQKP
jgi:hypothetical protein